jgi:hypothetical protein
VGCRQRDGGSGDADNDYSPTNCLEPTVIPADRIVWPMIFIDARWQIEATPDEHTEMR